MKNLKGDCGKTVYNFLFNISIVCDSIFQFQVVTRFFLMFFLNQKKDLRYFQLLFHWGFFQ